MIPYVNDRQFPNNERECHIFIRGGDSPILVVPTERFSYLKGDEAYVGEDLIARYDIPAQLTAKAVNILLDTIAPFAERMANAHRRGDIGGRVDAQWECGRTISDFLMDEVDLDDPEMWIDWCDR